MDEDESKFVIVDGGSIKESKLECVHKIVNKKYAINETEHEEPLVTDNTVVK